MSYPRGVRRLWGIWGLLGVILEVVGCAGYASVVEDRFKYDFDCPRVEVHQVAGTTYAASGCGERATYTCARGGRYSDNVCVQESSSAGRKSRLEVAKARSVQKNAAGKATRRYDEQTKAQVVQADFVPSAGVHVRLVGAPKVKLGDVLVQLHLPTRAQGDCATLDALVTDMPASGRDVTVESKGSGRDVSAHFDFQQLKPLARNYPSFALVHCDLKVQLSEAAVGELRKFMVMYSDIATDVQGESAPEPADVERDAMEL